MLGGTRFVGRHIAEAALEREHRLTLFNRGVSGPELFPGAESRRGDRGGDHSALAGGSWDAVVDVSAYRAAEVRAAAASLRGRARLYALISTISVYKSFEEGGDESAPTWDALERGDASAENYGPLKRGCERALQSAWDGPALIVRPGLIAGPQDPTDRFTYWPVRLSRKGRAPALSPGSPGKTAQFIDARDLARWLMLALESGLTGVYNAVGDPLRFDSMLELCAEASGKRPKLVWADDAFLCGHGLRPYVDLPLWVPGEPRPFDNSRARAAGLELRPVSQTAADTLRWHADRGAPARLQAGLAPELEARLLAELQHRP